MLCQKCGKNIATTYITKTINGSTTQTALCSECAAGEGIGFGGLSAFSPFSPGSLFGPLFGVGLPAKQAVGTKRCSHCGSAFEEIAETGFAGCPFCYTEFYDRLLPSIERIHGRASHNGKMPGNISPELKAKNELKELEKQLKTAVSEQDYEQAAVLRDKINGIKNSQENKSSKKGNSSDNVNHKTINNSNDGNNINSSDNKNEKNEEGKDNE